MRPSRRALLMVSLALNLILLAAWAIPLRLTGAQSDVRDFPETHHSVRGIFLSYWTAHGGLAQQGFPLTEEFQEQNKLNGKTYTVQYFERAIFELHPDKSAAVQRAAQPSWASSSSMPAIPMAAIPPPRRSVGRAAVRRPRSRPRLPRRRPAGR